MLRPYSNLANLKVWDYFTTEDLAHGPSYDIEVAQKELSQNEETETLEMLGNLTRRVVNGCYDNIMLQQPDYYQWQFQVGASMMWVRGCVGIYDVGQGLSAKQLFPLRANSAILKISQWPQKETRCNFIINVLLFIILYINYHLFIIDRSE